MGTLEKHIDHLTLELNLFYVAEVTFKLAKCKFFTNIIDNLGHVIRPR